jgi:hypothetical protein
MHLGIGTLLEGCDTILPWEIPSFGVLLMVVENVVSGAAPECPISVPLDWDLVTETGRVPQLAAFVLFGPLSFFFGDHLQSIFILKIYSYVQYIRETRDPIQV